MSTTLGKVGKWLLWIFGILVGVLVLILVAFSLIYSPEYVIRVLRWGDADVYDYQKFPERSMEASAQINLVTIALTTARPRLVVGPASATQSMSFLGFLK